jgi:hypothetical protein
MFGKVVAERQGFEPWIPYGIHAFQACAIGHSAISPATSMLPRWLALFRLTRERRSRWDGPIWRVVWYAARCQPRTRRTAERRAHLPKNSGLASAYGSLHGER